MGKLIKRRKKKEKKKEEAVGISSPSAQAGQHVVPQKLERADMRCARQQLTALFNTNRPGIGNVTHAQV
jgi:hypothetical protein